MTKEQALIRIKHSSMYKYDRETADYIIKALEQYPSDDCVSREQALLQLTGVNLSDKTTEELIGLFGRRINELPPVTPTHGTCKDCTNYVVGALDEEICIRGHELIHKDFYCRDFKRRGSENV